MRSKTIGSSTPANNTGGATADYFSVASWEASIADTDDETGTIITKVAPTDTASVLLNAANTGPWAYLLTVDSTCAVAAPSQSEFNAKARIVVTGASDMGIGIYGTGWTVEKLGVYADRHGYGAIGGTESATFRRVLATSNADATGGFVPYGSGTNKFTISNSACWGNTYGFLPVNAATMDVYQSSTLGGTYGFWANGGGTFNAYACISQGAGTDFSGGIGGNDNVSQDTTAPGSNTKKAVSGVYVNTSGGSENLALNGLNGALLPGVADYSGSCPDCATDIAGNPRPLASSFPIDPGCIMIAAGPSVLAYGGGGATKSSEPMTASINPPVANCLLVAMIGVSGDTINTVDFGGAALTSVAAAAQNNSGLRTYVYTLSNPATGSATLTVDVNAGFSRGWFSVFALKYASDSNAPTVDVGDGVTFTSTDSSKTKATTTAQANEGCLSIWANGGSGSAPVPDSPAVLREAGTNPPNFFQAAVSARLAVSAGSTTDGWSFNSGSAGALSVVYIKPGSGGGGGSAGTITSMLSLMGVG